MIDKRRRPSTEPLEEAFGVPFKPELLERALTHRSYAYENGGLPTNERLEFLGDSVLGLVVTDELYPSRRATPASEVMFTTEARNLASWPSGRSGWLRYSSSVTTRRPRAAGRRTRSSPTRSRR